MFVFVCVCAQGFYNRPLLVRVVDSACLQCYQLAAVFIASSSIFQMTFKYFTYQQNGKRRQLL